MVLYKDLKEGMKVMIHPTSKSQSNHPYTARITRKMINWAMKNGVRCGPQMEWCTDVDGQGAVINDYLLSRMEIIG